MVAGPGAFNWVTVSMRYTGWAIAALLLLTVMPNLVWLATSTVRIHNASDKPIPAVAYRACEATHRIGALRPGESRFRFLEACGDDSLEILIDDAKFCRIYVEGELYHVDAAITAIDAVECSYDDLLSGLFVEKIVR